jgi:hypothetical protein
MASKIKVAHYHLINVSLSTTYKYDCIRLMLQDYLTVSRPCDEAGLTCPKRAKLDSLNRFENDLICEEHRRASHGTALL